MPDVFNKQKPKSSRSPSLHQKQMRAWTVGLILAALVLFGALFYLANRLPGAALP